MKRTLITASILALMATNSHVMAAECGPAIQNWVNGSKTTCPVRQLEHGDRTFITPAVNAPPASRRTDYCHEKGEYSSNEVRRQRTRFLTISERRFYVS